MTQVGPSCQWTSSVMHACAQPICVRRGLATGSLARHRPPESVLGYLSLELRLQYPGPQPYAHWLAHCTHLSSLAGPAVASPCGGALGAFPAAGVRRAQASPQDLPAEEAQSADRVTRATRPGRGAVSRAPDDGGEDGQAARRAALIAATVGYPPPGPSLGRLYMCGEWIG